MVDNPLCQLALVNLYHSEAVVPVTSGDQKFVVRREDKQMMADGDVLSKWCTNVLPRSMGGGQLHDYGCGLHRVLLVKVRVGIKLKSEWSFPST